MARDRSSVEAASSRLNSQLPIAEKLSYADYVVDNSGDRQELEGQVESLIRKLERDAGWSWRLSWFPLWGILSALATLVGMQLRLRRRLARKRRGQPHHQTAGRL
jgi:dephospho-CoA kinase